MLQAQGCIFNFNMKMKTNITCAGMSYQTVFRSVKQEILYQEQQTDSRVAEKRIASVQHQDPKKGARSLATVE